MRLTLVFVLGLLGSVSAVQAADPCVSGVPVGQRPGPYSALVSVGPERGTAHCFICETADRPAVVIFARSLSDPLGRLVRGVDKAIDDHKAAELRGWVTFLHDDQLTFDPQVVQWSKKQAIRNVSLGVFEDLVGPPSYKLNRDADVTVLLFVKQKVVGNFAFRAGDLTPARVDEVLKTLPRILPEGKK
jgi:hypothetical protein